MEPLTVIDIVRRTMRILNFDYSAMIKGRVQIARENDAVVTDPPSMSAGINH